MFKAILISSLFLLSGTTCMESIYTLSVVTIEGNTRAMGTYSGKKLLIITLPTVQNSSNDLLLHDLDSLGLANADSLIIIATPSYEDGYTPANKSALTTWYRSILNSNIVITDGLYTRKTSGTQQHPLFKWLTDKEKNGHFDLDVTGTRNKFFIWTDGELTGVLSAETKLGGLTMNELIQGW